MEFDNKNIIITGASTGIGKAIVYQLLQTDCNLIFLARRIELLEEIVRNNPNAKAKLFPIKCDVSSKQNVQEVYLKIRENIGPIDIAILNSGVSVREKIENFSSSDVEFTFSVNVLGIVYWIEQLLPDFLNKKDGMIVGVSSLADNRGYSGSGGYCASKAAASVYLEGLRTDLKPLGVKVITVKPGFVKTPMTDKNDFYMPFMISAEKSAKIILNGIRKEKSVIKFPFSTSLGSSFIGMIPDRIYDLIGKKLS